MCFSKMWDRVLNMLSINKTRRNSSGSDLGLGLRSFFVFPGAGPAFLFHGNTGTARSPEAPRNGGRHPTDTLERVRVGLDQDVGDSLACDDRVGGRIVLRIALEGCEKHPHLVPFGYRGDGVFCLCL